MNLKSISFKLPLLVITIFIIGCMAILIISEHQFKQIINSSQKSMYIEKVNVICNTLQKYESRLKKTGMVDAYQDSFKDAAIKDIKTTYYKTLNNHIYPTIIDTNAIVIAHPKFHTGFQAPKEDMIIKNMLKSDAGEFTAMYEGLKKWYVFKKFKPWGYVVSYTVPVDIKYKDAKTSLIVLIKTMIITGLAVFIILVLALRKFTNPIIELTNISSEFANGNIDKKINIKRDDEIGILAKSFATMQDAIRQKINELEDHKQNLETTVTNRTDELKKVHQDLVEYANQAGKAEIATGVLHNIGNLLTNIVVSSNLLHKSIDNDLIKKLLLVSNIIKNNKDNLGDFLTNDIQGKAIAQLFIELPKHLVDNKNDNIAYLKKIEDTIEIIRNSVQAQQNYAHQGSLEQRFSLKSEIKALMDLEKPTMTKHNIKVETNLNADPTILANRSIFANTFMNLLRNAKDALKNKDINDRHIKVDLNIMSEISYVEIAITDNGEGIPSALLSKIFSYGFTTKRDGFGFGLHQSANDIKSQGGDLFAISDGVGKGATFKIQLPADKIV